MAESLVGGLKGVVYTGDDLGIGVLGSTAGSMDVLCSYLGAGTLVG